jgi:hypothetical protein
MLEQPVVHQPELPLHSGRFRCLGGTRRMGVNVGLRIVAEAETQLVAELSEKLVHDGPAPEFVRLAQQFGRKGEPVRLQQPLDKFSVKAVCK